MKRVYFDNNATTGISEELKLDLLSALDVWGNPSSVHESGRKAKALLDWSREYIASSLNTKVHNILFTSGATESNNMIINSFNRDYVIFCADGDHPSILYPCKGNKAEIISLDNITGSIDLHELEKRFKFYKDKGENKLLLSTCYANSITGIIASISDLLSLCKEYGVLVHLDITQALGKDYIEKALEADFLSASAHKLGGLKGSGILYSKKMRLIRNLIIGGSQEYNKRPGTENTLAIYSFAKALEDANKNKEKNYNYVLGLRDLLEIEILKKCPETFIFGYGHKRLANTSAIVMPNVLGNQQVINFDLLGYEVSSGTACSSGAVSYDVNDWLKMLIPEDKKHLSFVKSCFSSFIRVSLSKQNTSEEVLKFVKLWIDMYNKSVT